MAIVGHHTVLKTESYIVIGEKWFWGDVREDGKDKLVREFENCDEAG